MSNMMEAAFRLQLNWFLKRKILFCCLILVFCFPSRFCNRVLDDGQCTIQCPKGQFELDHECHLCHHACLECNGSEPNKCTACGTGKDTGLFRFLRFDLTLKVDRAITSRIFLQKEQLISFYTSFVL